MPLLPAPTKADFALVGTPDTGYEALTFTPPASYAAELQISIKVKTRIINGGINGFSSGSQGNGNYVAICRRQSDKQRETGEMNQTVGHELGHKVNFTTGPEPAGSPERETPNGAEFRWLDTSSTHYRARGHVGGHCYNGAVLNPTSTSKGGSVAKELKPDFGHYDGRCVMFGSGGEGSKRPISFCGNCAPKLIRLDLETGWTLL